MNATTIQKSNYGEIVGDNNLLFDDIIKQKSYYLDSDSDIKFIINESKYNTSGLSQTKDGLQMSDSWINGSVTNNDRILKAVSGDKKLAKEIKDALRKGQVGKILSKIDKDGKVKTFLLNSNGKIIREWT